VTEHALTHHDTAGPSRASHALLASLTRKRFTKKICHCACEKPPQAARRIARAWRCHVFTRAYRAARDVLLRRGGLVPARTPGTPPGPYDTPDIIHDAPLALRLANPAEARLADDRGACVHVRLRLGVHHAGTQRREPFSPPSVYYRVYTHHPVADLNALSPEAYFEDAKRDAEAYARGKSRSESLERATPTEPRRISDANASASLRYVRLERNDWRPLPANAARALAEDERMSAEAALATLPGFSDPRRGATVHRQGAESSRKLARSSRNALGRRRRSTSSTQSAASGGLTARRGTARATVRGVRRDAAATRAALRRRARAWSAGGDGSACGSTEYNSEYDSAGEDEELDSLLEWSAGLDFEAFDASWREKSAPPGEASETNATRRE